MVGGANGITVTYQAAADPDGSETKTSAPQTNFWQYAMKLFGATLPPDTGLFSNAMPGEANVAQPMHWNAANQWWTAEGIPIIPKNKFGDTQTYPLVRVMARDAGGGLLASVLVTAPVSSEMNCATCHGSNKQAATMPGDGWVNDPDPVRDYRLNIIKLHDSKQAGNANYPVALAAVGYSPLGLYDSVVEQQQPVLCASCHSSNALGTAGVAGVPPLTQAMHAGHASAIDPLTGASLGSSTNRASCYQCHPGKQTKCLRGAMGKASDHFGQPLMSCQSCHGGMVEVGAAGRTGWLEEPGCQSCHTGTEVTNAGQVRFTSSFLPNGDVREPADNRFATTPDRPAPGFSLFRFSKGHGDLTCSACHGSPHAIYPTNQRNDNIQSITVQGHVGTIGDCAVCHQNDTASLQTTTGGPHGMHGIGNWWITEHHDHVGNIANCNACHGTTSAGGVLSQALGPRSFNTQKFGTVTFWQGQRVSCYDCHDGPNQSRPHSQAKPVVQGFALQTAVGTAAVANFQGSDADTATLTYRIVTPPSHGTLALSGTQFAYTPDPGFSGTDAFTYCARDNRTDSNLAKVDIDVGTDAPQADLDGDGIPDLVERAFGLDVSRVSRGTAPEIAFCEEGGVRSLQAMYNPALIPQGFQVFFEASEDLQNWSTTDPAILTSQDAAGNVIKKVAIGPRPRL
ncbi:MAG: hypothetical protein KDJ36_12550, partial [Hyphomicrobiaceae bacterium]|nr:hypothetical protein [Hyphomicrobiaceae bacterium]